MTWNREIRHVYKRHENILLLVRDEKDSFEVKLLTLLFPFLIVLVVLVMH